MIYDNGGSVPPGPPGQPQYPHYPPPYPPPVPPPRRGPRWPWIVGIAVAAVLVLVAGAVAVVVVLRADSGVSAQTFTVTYEVTGSGTARVDYWNADGGRSTPEVVPLPWSTEVVMQGEKPFVSVSAVQDATPAVSLRCRITANGATVSENRSNSRGIGCDAYLGEQ